MEETLKKDAYTKGLKLKDTGLDQDTIAIRLEKQGVPYELAQEVAKNVFLQRKIDQVNNQLPPTFGSRSSFIKILFNEFKLWLELKRQKK